MHYRLKTILPMLLLFVSAIDKPTTASQPSDKDARVIIADSLFAYKNITNTFFLKDISWENKQTLRLFTDSSYKRAFVNLDGNQLCQLLASALKSDPAYVSNYMRGYFIAKQDMVFDFTPIIVLVTDEGFRELLYILLNKDSKPVSSFVLFDNECGIDLWDVNDTMVSYCPVKQSLHIEGKRFVSFTRRVLRKKEWLRMPCNEQYPSYLDSVSVETIIQPNGTFKTTQLDSVRLLLKNNRRQ